MLKLPRWKPLGQIARKRLTVEHCWVNGLTVFKKSVITAIEPKKNVVELLSEVESSRTSLASRTHFEVLGLGLGLEASSPRKLLCPRLEDSTII